MNNIKVGDLVKLIGLPDWLIHDLPEDEKIEMRDFIGRSATVAKIDSYGYLWLGFGSVVSMDANGYYSGHSFAVPQEFLELITRQSEE